jgi:hypothetical protein
MEFRFSVEEEDLRNSVSDFVQREIVEKEIDKLDLIPADIIKKWPGWAIFL